MKLVVGLGNPGARYRGTRHNVGFEVIGRLVSKYGLGLEPWRGVAEIAEWRLPDRRVWFLKPLTFMNLSGEAVAEVVTFFKIEVENVLVVCDDVNLPLGRLRGRTEGSEGGHNGLRSIAEALGTTGYSRLRIGVGRGEDERDLADHVLARFAPEEVSGIDEAMTRAADAVDVWITDGTARMMNLFNRAEGTIT